MSDISQQSQIDLEKEKLELKRYKIRLDYKKFVLGSVFVALAIAAIPPLFQLATAGLEYIKSNSERLAKQQEFRDGYIKEFLSNALNQDIELRIRFAQYFARVATEPTRPDWVAYLGDLKVGRDTIRKQIDEMEAEWSAAASAKNPDDVEVARLERHLAWAYKEVGYVEKNRSAAANPRSPEAPSFLANPTNSLYLSRFADPVYFLTRPLSWKGSKYEGVEVPVGFVVTFDSVPQSLIRPEGDFIIPMIIHDYLYWTQAKSREVSDEIFRLALQDFAVDQKMISTFYQAIRAFGQQAWDDNARLKAQGEKRVLKEFPKDPKTRWSDWKTRPGVFSDASP
jgi:Protein of unknown function (DUF1353)